MKKKSSFLGGLFFRPDFLILGIAIVLGLFLVGGLTPFNFKNTPPTEGEFVPDTEAPAGGDKSLQLRTIKLKSCTGTLGIDFAIDRSDTMNESQPDSNLSKINTVKIAMKNFVTKISDESLFGLVSFGGSNGTLDFPIDKLGSRRSAISTRIDSLTAGGSTPMIYALEKANADLKNAIQQYPKYKLSLILLSDGMWNTGGDPTSVINDIKAKKVRIFTIAYGNQGIQSFMKQSASTTTDSFFAAGSQEIENILSQISIKLCN